MKMKLILLSLFMLAACTQMEQPEQTVTFEIGSVKEEGSMTKADILPLIRKPSEVQLLLTNLSNGRLYTLKTGESKAIQVGNYKVTGKYENCPPIYTKSRGFASDEPSIKIDTEITVTEGEKTYDIPAIWDCSAIVYSTNMVSEVQFGAWNPNLPAIDTLKLFYVCGDAISVSCTFDSKDPTKYDNTSFVFGTKGTPLEKGKWYFASPKGITTGNSGMGLDIDDMTEGGTI